VFSFASSLKAAILPKKEISASPQMRDADIDHAHCCNAEQSRGNRFGVRHENKIGHARLY
jgi:hypothetical protein